MVRTYERTPGSKRYRDFTEEDLTKALQAVRDGMSKKLAAETYNIPRTTLIRKIAGKNPGPVGHPRVLSSLEEASIAETLGVVANWGFPLTKLDVRNVIAKYIEKQGKTVNVFKNNIPGEDFLDGFIKRNKLSIRLASNIKRSRSSVDRQDILTFFNNINEALKGVQDFSIYNYDETNITDDPGAKKLLFHATPRELKECKIIHELQSVSWCVEMPKGIYCRPWWYTNLQIYMKTGKRGALLEQNMQTVPADGLT